MDADEFVIGVEDVDPIAPLRCGFPEGLTRPRLVLAPPTPLVRPRNDLTACLSAHSSRFIGAAVVHDYDFVAEQGSISKRPSKVSVGRCFVPG